MAKAKRLASKGGKTGEFASFGVKWSAILGCIDQDLNVGPLENLFLRQCKLCRAV
jgi:hypothetical protein